MSTAPKTAEPQHGDVPPPVKHATQDQKQEIQRLLNNPQITRPEKTKMLLNINQLGEKRALIAIKKLRLTIDHREAGEKDPGWRVRLQAFLGAHKQRIGKEHCSRLAVVAYLPASTDNQLLNALAEAQMLAEAGPAQQPDEADETAAA